MGGGGGARNYRPFARTHGLVPVPGTSCCSKAPPASPRARGMAALPGGGLASAHRRLAPVHRSTCCLFLKTLTQRREKRSTQADGEDGNLGPNPGPARIKPTRLGTQHEEDSERPHHVACVSKDLEVPKGNGVLLWGPGDAWP